MASNIAKLPELLQCLSCTPPAIARTEGQVSRHPASCPMVRMLGRYFLSFPRPIDVKTLVLPIPVHPTRLGTHLGRKQRVDVRRIEASDQVLLVLVALVCSGHRHGR
jgi:hypothetical protein